MCGRAMPKLCWMCVMPTCARRARTTCTGCVTAMSRNSPSSRCWACDLFAVLLVQEADHRALARFLQSDHAEVWLVAAEMRSDDLGGPGDLLWSQGVERVTHGCVGRRTSRWLIDCMSLSISNGTSWYGCYITLDVHEGGQTMVVELNRSKELAGGRIYSLPVEDCWCRR